MDKALKELAQVIEKYFGADAGYLDISCLDLAKRILDAGWEKPEWISVKDRLPEESGDYLVILDWGKMCVLEYSKVHQAFNASDSIPNDSEIFCTHWMPVPNRRKENDYV